MSETKQFITLQHIVTYVQVRGGNPSNEDIFKFVATEESRDLSHSQLVDIFMKGLPKINEQSVEDFLKTCYDAFLYEEDGISDANDNIRFLINRRFNLN
jgi:hypothetical protein